MPVSHDVEIVTIFEEMPDPRVEGRCEHRLVDILFVALCGAISGADSWVEIAEFAEKRLDWLRQFVPLENGAPSHDTFSRVFAQLDTDAFAGVMSGWMSFLQEETDGKVVAIDGKTLRRSFDRASGKSALHVISAWSTDNGLMLGQTAVEEKSNEITAIPVLLEFLDLKGATVTIDAMGCQKEIAAKIRSREADYLLNLKDNHPTLRQAVEEAFLREAEKDFRGRKVRRIVHCEKGHGREERREYVIMPVPAKLSGKGEWRDLQCIAMVLRQRVVDGHESAEISYYLTSLPPKVKAFANAARSHWGIENSLHWSLDVSFSEDQSRTRKGAGPETTALLQRVAVSLLRQDTSRKRSIRVKRLAAALDPDEVTRFLAGSP